MSKEKLHFRITPDKSSEIWNASLFWPIRTNFEKYIIHFCLLLGKWNVMQWFNWFCKWTCDREWSTVSVLPPWKTKHEHAGLLYMLCCRCCSSQGVEAVTQIVRAARGACDDPAMTYRPRACEGGALAASFTPPPHQDRTNRSHQTPPPPPT